MYQSLFCEEDSKKYESFADLVKAGITPAQFVQMYSCPENQKKEFIKNISNQVSDDVYEELVAAVPDDAHTIDYFIDQFDISKDFIKKALREIDIDDPDEFLVETESSYADIKQIIVDLLELLPEEDDDYLTVDRQDDYLDILEWYVSGGVFLDIQVGNYLPTLEMLKYEDIDNIDKNYRNWGDAPLVMDEIQELDSWDDFDNKDEMNYFLRDGIIRVQPTGMLSVYIVINLKKFKQEVAGLSPDLARNEIKQIRSRLNRNPEVTGREKILKNMQNPSLYSLAWELMKYTKDNISSPIPVKELKKLANENPGIASLIVRKDAKELLQKNPQGYSIQQIIDAGSSVKFPEDSLIAIFGNGMFTRHITTKWGSTVQRIIRDISNNVFRLDIKPEIVNRISVKDDTSRHNVANYIKNRNYPFWYSKMSHPSAMIGA